MTDLYDRDVILPDINDKNFGIQTILFYEIDYDSSWWRIDARGQTCISIEHVLPDNTRVNITNDHITARQ